MINKTALFQMAALEDKNYFQLLNRLQEMEKRIILLRQYSFEKDQILYSVQNLTQTDESKLLEEIGYYAHGIALTVERLDSHAVQRGVPKLLEMPYSSEVDLVIKVCSIFDIAYSEEVQSIIRAGLLLSSVSKATPVRV